MTVKASDTSTIDATVAAFAASVSVSFGGGSTAVGIGASLAHNRISDGTDLGDGSVDAYIATSNINAASVAVAATSQQSISALTAAVAVAISGGDGSGLGVSGAGAVALNEIDLSGQRYHRRFGDRQCRPAGHYDDADLRHHHDRRSVTVTAEDSSAIDALVAAAAVAGGFGGEDGLAVAIGVSFARNSITNPVNAAITNVLQLTTSGGAVTVAATEAAQIDAETYAAAVALSGGGTTGGAVAGGGAIAWNVIGVDTTATISGTTIGRTGNAAGDIIVTAIDSSDDQRAGRLGCRGRRHWRRGRGRRRDRRRACGKRNRQRRHADREHQSRQRQHHRQLRRHRSRRLFDPDHQCRHAGGPRPQSPAVARPAWRCRRRASPSKISSRLRSRPTSPAPARTSVTAGRIEVDAYDESQIDAVDGAAAVSASVAGEGAVSVSIGLSLAQNTIQDPVAAYIRASRHRTRPSTAPMTARCRTATSSRLRTAPSMNGPAPTTPL